jgi:septal ring factor EnvC (AmiA/AmiB activator)
MASERDDRLDRILESQNEQLAGVKHSLAGIERTLARQERDFERQEKAFEFQARTFENTIALLERMIARLDDMGDQIRANTQAVLRRLDRLDGPQPDTGG